MVVTDLATIDVPYGRAPRQAQHDAAPTGKRIEFDLVVAGPAVFLRSAKH